MLACSFRQSAEKSVVQFQFRFAQKCRRQAADDRGPVRILIEVQQAGSPLARQARCLRY